MTLNLASVRAYGGDLLISKENSAVPELRKRLKARHEFSRCTYLLVVDLGLLKG
jgi:hypothetical protein